MEVSAERIVRVGQMGHRELRAASASMALVYWSQGIHFPNSMKTNRKTSN
jgi:hypothetical protein